jgi:hypothetical protein
MWNGYSNAPVCKAYLQQLHQQVQRFIAGMWEHVCDGLGLQHNIHKHTQHVSVLHASSAQPD